MKKINLIAIIVGFASFFIPFIYPETNKWFSIGWGLLFLSWVFQAVNSGSTQFLSIATKENEPLEFWLTNVLWFLFSMVFILRPFFPEYLGA
ncbi:hypothetical protein WH52_10980 [Tenacibaculum holothuriorum]|uniref:Uncharacterized protein n=1 Tax=Tenacibaculum holothuriorum TaxID=1635173 RepID=A0A1Y2PC80_9FLAO|nr:hypothetical protein [Tenacibaculum holothuriorum]OSY87397.1 hypothetical protein WH52_10980 [Tenacibaculum holothuriorum]